MRTLFSNPYFNASFWSWFTAQALKVILTLIKERKLDFYRFVGSGGMPSSHSAMVMGLSTAIGLKMGWDSLEYAVSIIFSLIIMYDASGVRRAVGKQAMILNQMIKDRQQNKQIEEKQLKELVGHTPIEVFAGAILGILIANLLI
ncbi:MAG TPA: divergent PAP2 family protein [Clostridia bacterium]|nr:divergent PAP2 family protein [Clostridia bacterium]